MNAVAHHQTHGTRVVIGPDAFRARALLGLLKFLGNEIERVVPGNSLEFTCAFVAFAPQRMQQPLGVVLALGVAGNLGADHTGCVVVVLRTAHTPDRPLVEQLDFQRAGRWAIVRARGCPDANRRTDAPHRFVHRATAFPVL